MKIIAEQIVKKLRNKGFKAYYAGGCVRDMIMRKTPQDFDIATNATPIEIEHLFPRTIMVGAQFGVVVVVKQGIEFEVATFRADGKYLDGRRPSKVTFTDAQGDVKRRDFTVNGLLYDPLKKKVLDYVKGKKDIKQKIIRCIGKPNIRFQEDKLRLLRAIRFSCNLNFTIERNTWKAVKENAHLIKQVSAERIRDELIKILTGLNPHRGIQLLWQANLLKQILSEVCQLRGVRQTYRFHPEGDVWRHTLKMFDLGKNLHPELALAILLHDIGKPPTRRVKDRIRFNGHDRVGEKMAETICQRLKMSNKQIARIKSLVVNHMKFINVKKMRVSTLKRFLWQDYFADHLKLHFYDCAASHISLSNYYFCKRKLKEFQEEQKKPLLPPSLLNGHEIMALGYPGGPIIRKIKDFLVDSQLENRIKNKGQAKKEVKKNFKL